LLKVCSLRELLGVLLGTAMLLYVFVEVLSLYSEIASQNHAGNLPATYPLVDPAPAHPQPLAYLRDCEKLLAVLLGLLLLKAL
jgi:hypothetical protein